MDFEFFLDNLPVMAWALNDHGKIVYGNRLWYEYSGHDADSVITDPSVLSSEDLPLTQKNWNQAKAENREMTFERRLRHHQTGQVHWFRHTAKPASFPSQPSIAWIGTSYIIHQSSHELIDEESEMWWLSLIDNMPQLVWCADENGFVSYCNKRYREYFGIDKGRDVDEAWARTVHPEDRERVEKHWYECITTKKYFVDQYRLLNPDTNQYRWFLTTSACLPEAIRNMKWVGTNTDIDDQKKAESLVRLSHDRLQLIQSTLPIVFFSVDPVTCSYEAFVHSADSQKKVESLLNVLNGCEQSLYADVVNQHQTITTRKEANQCVYQITLTPQLGSDGRVRSVLGLGVDVTETENAIKEKSELVMREQLALESSKMKSQFLANMSHELRTPLNGIINVVDFFKETPLNSEQYRYITTIESQAQYLSVLVNDVLEISKVESGFIYIRSEPFNLLNVIQESLETQQQTALTKQLQMRIVIDQCVPVNVRGDPYRLKQVLTNLLNNAVKFTEKGHVEVVVKVQEEHDNTITLQIHIKDTGIGMTPDTINVAFKPFFQGDNSDTRRFGGSGLGLYISKLIIDRMHGDIHITSQVGKGTDVVVVLDFLKCCEPAVTLDTTAAEKQIHPNLHGKCIMVAEDNDVNLFITKHILENNNVHVLTAKDGQEAINVFKDNSEQIDLVLMDIQMPVLDGFTAAAAIKKIRKVPILSLTASASKEDVQQSFLHGLDGHISKPFRQEELVQAISKHL